VTTSRVCIHVTNRPCVKYPLKTLGYLSPLFLAFSPFNFISKKKSQTHTHVCISRQRERESPKGRPATSIKLRPESSDLRRPAPLLSNRQHHLPSSLFPSISRGGSLTLSLRLTSVLGGFGFCPVVQRPQEVADQRSGGRSAAELVVETTACSKRRRRLGFSL
jgi:hypothetical protein